MVIKEKRIEKKPLFEQIRAIYSFVKNDIKFGFNDNDNISASQVLMDGLGQCNTKANLLMALLCALGIPCRIHFFTIDKNVQKGLLTVLHFMLIPKLLIHSWVEVLYKKEWIILEGVIIDNEYFSKIKGQIGNFQSFSGYAIACNDLSNLSLEWNGESTYIQNVLIKDDLGLYKTPDEYYNKYSTNLTGLKKVLFQKHIKPEMNEMVKKIRNGVYKIKKK